MQLSGEQLQASLSQLEASLSQQEASQRRTLRGWLEAKEELDVLAKANRMPAATVQHERARPLIGSQRDDILQGSDNDDTLWANAGKDHLIGGFGNDKLYGGDGDDVYEFAPGFGRDEINYDFEGNDTIVFAPGISPEQIMVLRDGTQLILRILESMDQITVKGHFNANSSARQIERAHFADGRKVRRLHSTIGNTGCQTAIGHDQ